LFKKWLTSLLISTKQRKHRTSTGVFVSKHLAFWHVLVDFSGCFQHGQITIVMAPYFSDMADQNPDGHGRVAGIIVAF